MSNTSQSPFLTKVKSFSWAIALFIAVIVLFQTCSTAKKVSALASKVNALPTSSEVKNQVQIEGFRISKRMLYDNNAVIRTAVRPDDRMNQYDEEIKKIEANK